MLEEATGEMAWPRVLSLTICAAIDVSSRGFNLSKAKEKKNGVTCSCFNFLRFTRKSSTRVTIYYVVEEKTC